MMAELGQTTTMRNAARSLNLLLDSGVSANSVMKAVHDLGPQISKLAEASEYQVKSRHTPHHLVIEGDAFEIKVQDPGQTQPRNALVHHYLVYEVIKDEHSQSGYRHINQHNFLNINHEAVKNRVSAYLNGHYRLRGQTIYLGSDAGPGYNPAQMLELVPAMTHGEYFVDRYHCLRKVKDIMRDQPELMHLTVKHIRNHDLAKLMPVLDTYQSLLTTALASKNFDRLVNYLARNWLYLSSPSQRHCDDCVHLGTIESNHRAFNYRMKKQGKHWPTSGARASKRALMAN